MIHRHTWRNIAVILSSWTTTVHWLPTLDKPVESSSVRLGREDGMDDPSRPAERTGRVTFKETANDIASQGEDEVSDEVPIVCRHGATDQQRREDLENAIAWLRKELQAMRSQDRTLAKQLIGLRSKIQEIMKGEGDADESGDLDATDGVDTRTG